MSWHASQHIGTFWSNLGPGLGPGFVKTRSFQSSLRIKLSRKLPDNLGELVCKVLFDDKLCRVFIFWSWKAGVLPYPRIIPEPKYFQHHSEIHQRDTRQKNNLTLPKHRILTGQRAFTYQSGKNFLTFYLWKETRNTKSPNLFKKKIFTNIFNS